MCPSTSIARRSGRSGVVILLTIALGAEPSRADYMSVGESMSRAVAQSPRLRAEEQRQIATEQDVLSSQMAFLPRVSGTVEWSITKSRKVRPASRADFGSSPSSYGVSVSQPIFDGLQRFNNLRRARANAQAGRQIFADAQQTILLEVAAAQLAVCRDREILELRRQSLKNVKRIAALTQTSYKSGAASLTDVEQSRARTSLAQADVDEAMGNLAASQTEYERLTGQPPGELVRPKVPAGLLPVSAEEAVEISGANNPRVIAAYLNADASRYAAYAALGEVSPTVDLSVDGERLYNDTNAVQQQDDISVNLNLRVPLIDATLVPNIARANATAKQQAFEAIDLRQNIAASAQAAYLKHRAAVHRINSIEGQVVASRAAVKGVLAEAAAGQQTVIQVLDAELQRAIAEVNLAVAKFERDETAFTLLASIGRIADVTDGATSLAEPGVVQGWTTTLATASPLQWVTVELHE